MPSFGVLRAGAVALVLLCGAPAWAAFSSASVPSGFTGSSAQWLYQRAVDGASWSSAKTVRLTTGLNVAGRTIPLQAALRMGAGAGAFAARALMLNPGWLAVGAVATWVAGEFLFDEQTGWMRRQYTQGEVTCWGFSSSEVDGHCWTSPSDRMADAWPAGSDVAGAGTVAQQSVCSFLKYVSIGGVQHEQWSCTRPYKYPYESFVRYQTSVEVTGYKRTGEVEAPPRPATPTDFEEWGDEVGLPADVPNAVPMPVPVGVPALNPTGDPDANPRPIRIPTGAPVPVPGTDPQKYRQPVIDVIPSGTVDEPWRVDMQPKEIEGDDPVGISEPQVIGEEDPLGEPTEEQKQLCEVYPDIVACMEPGDAEDFELPDESRDVAFAPASGFGPDDAVCPAPTVMSTGLAGNLELSWQPACDYASGLRPVVIASASLAAVLIFIGGLKED